MDISIIYYKIKLLQIKGLLIFHIHNYQNTIIQRDHFKLVQP